MKTAIVCFFLLLSTVFIWGQSTKPPVPFEAKAISRSGNAFWICGANSSIAMSADGGASWQIKNSKPSGATLLSIRWRDEKLGAAGGTGGTVLLSMDGGGTWKQVPTTFPEPVLDLSFANGEHGLVLTTAAVMYTADGGTTWRTVWPSTPSELSRFKWALSVATLDDKHAAVLIKEGAAQYYDGRIVATADGGTSWKTTEIEHTTLNYLLVAQGALWLVGTEVIDRENKGGHAVPVTFYSRDASTWERGPKPLIDTNNACRPEGCLMWNGAWFDPFVMKGAIHVFPPIERLSTQWAATDHRICTVAQGLVCADSQIVKTLPEHGGPAPHLAAAELRPPGPDTAGKCIRCDYPPVLISDHFSGKATVKLTILALPDGTVSSVEVVSSTDAEVGRTLSEAVSQWMFYPVWREGVAAPTKRTLELTVNVIKPK
jgi:hypothetical protein